MRLRTANNRRRQRMERAWYADLADKLRGLGEGVVSIRKLPCRRGIVIEVTPREAV